MAVVAEGEDHRWERREAMALDLEARLSAVERSLKRWRMVAFVLAVGLAGLGAAAADPISVFQTSIHNEVRTQSLVITDKKGKEIGRFLPVEKDGAVFGAIRVTYYKDALTKTTDITPGNSMTHQVNDEISAPEMVIAKSFAVLGSKQQVLGVWSNVSENDVEKSELKLLSTDGSETLLSPKK
jgi:hypothetical protein